MWARHAFANGIIIIDSKSGKNNLRANDARSNFQILLMPEKDGDFIVDKMKNQRK